MTRPSETIETCIAVRNSGSREIVLYLEPWAEEFPMAPQAEIIVVGRGPQEGNGFGIEYLANAIEVQGWKGSVVQVFSQGKELGDVRHRPPVPF